MCLIIYKPDITCTLPDTHLDLSIGRNADGCGVMFVEDNRVVTDKLLGVDSTHDQRVAWCQWYYDAVPTLLMHHRFTTHGDNILENIHPYEVLNKDLGDPIDLYMMHNGVIHSVNDDPKYSDTWIYINDYLKPLLKAHPQLIYSKPFQKHIAEFIGKGSKLTFLDSEGNVIIINEEAGHIAVGGCWLSNNYSTVPKYVPPVHTHNYGRVDNDKSFTERSSYLAKPKVDNVIPLVSPIEPEDTDKLTSVTRTYVKPANSNVFFPTTTSLAVKAKEYPLSSYEAQEFEDEQEEDWDEYGRHTHNSTGWYADANNGQDLLNIIIRKGYTQGDLFELVIDDPDLAVDLLSDALDTFLR